jgi:hypothetical protein
MNIRQSTIKLLIYFSIAGVVFFGLANLIKILEPKPPVETAQEKHYKKRLKMFESHIKEDWNKVLIGDSHFEFFNTPKEYMNMGIAGDTTYGLLHRLKPFKLKTVEKMYIQIGINDILTEMKQTTIKTNYLYILDELAKRDIKEVYVISLMPVAKTLPSSEQINQKVVEINQYIQKLAKDKGVKYIDLYSKLEENGYLKSQLTTDGLHLNEKGYQILKEEI